MAQLNLKKDLDMTTTDYVGPFHIGGTWELSLTGTWTGTISVLRRFNLSDSWGVCQEYVENVEDSAFFKGGSIAHYLIAVTTPGTGACTVRAFK